MSLFGHSIGVPSYGGQVQWFENVFRPSVSHCVDGKETLEQGFDNRGVMRRSSSVNLRRIESSRGKGWWVLGWWSRHMRFMKGSSRMERELLSNGVARKAMGKGFGIKVCQSVVRDLLSLISRDN
jgi:hypothetical protein